VESAALLRTTLRLQSWLPLARYIRHRHRRRVQQGADDGLELVLGDFGDVGHGTIVSIPLSPERGSIRGSLGLPIQSSAF
jgi:hypothetical protein